MGNEEEGEWRLQSMTGSQGFQQNHVKVFVNHDISSPIVHDIPVCIILVLMLMGDTSEHWVDVNGAFLLGEFKHNEKIS